MQNPNPSEIVGLIARHQTRLRALVRCLLVRAADVDDVLQEINAVLWEKSSEFEAGTDFWAWASQIARFKALNQIRKYGRDRLVFDDETMNRLAIIAERRLQSLDDRREALSECLSRLPASQRQLIELRYQDGHALKLIAKSLNRPHASIRQTLYRIRESLIRCIEGKLVMGGKS